MLGVSLMTYSVKYWKLLATKFTLKGSLRFSSTVILSDMLIQIILGFATEIQTLVTLQCASRETLLVTVKIRLCSLIAPIFKHNFFVAIERMHLIDRSSTEVSERNVKSPGFSLLQCKKIIGKIV